MNESQKFEVSFDEQTALNMVLGLSNEAFDLVRKAKPTASGGYLLDGSDEAFSELSRVVGIELDERLCSPRYIGDLASFYVRLTGDES